MSYATARRRSSNGDINKLFPEDRAVHEWYRFVLSFPPHLVREYLDRFRIEPGQRVLDPFCGTGTTIVEAQKRGIIGIGVERNPMAQFASATKTDWSPDPYALVAHAERVADAAYEALAQEGIGDDVDRARLTSADRLRRLPADQADLLLTDSISPLPLHKSLVLIDCLSHLRDDRFFAHERLALAKALVYSSSNLHFGPEVGVGTVRPDAPVIRPWLSNVRAMADDLAVVNPVKLAACVYEADARDLRSIGEQARLDAVITSPPYPNEKDYTRTTRLESVLLGFVTSKAQLQALKRGLVRSNTRGVYRQDDEDMLIADIPEIQSIASEIERRRIEMGKTSGFERLYARVTKLYFGGMYRHLANLRPLLRPGARLAYVVGDQASYLRVMIRTGQILARVAEPLGYQVESIDLFRTRLATATREQLREEVVVLRWPGRFLE